MIKRNDAPTYVLDWFLIAYWFMLVSHFNLTSQLRKTSDVACATMFNRKFLVLVWDILESIRRKNIHQSSMGMYSCEETMATTTSVCWDIKRACLRSWSILSSLFLNFSQLKS
ncbi:hypothetical protein HAX54_005383 [Datura stramonium]|uniref:Uncharacterized protein n=1 Tax=Datura stramonium TaxID=4076 RepID=A0ABS8T9W4_DATST|nr:hypothetical protein [Datura stramonium]